MKKYINITGILLTLCLCFMSCSDDNNNTTMLKNDCLKRSAGPNVAGLNIEFAYAMAVPCNTGRIVSAQVEADIPGTEGTWMENNSYHTSRETGADVPVLIGNPSVTTGSKTEVEFTVDTCAATLRYYYQIPEEARGKQVSFTFSAKSSAGETASYKMGPYQISKMDIKKDITLTRANCYISIEDMAVYNATQAADIPSKIDLVYLWRDIEGITFGHAFVSPAAGPQYLPNITLPPGLTNDTRIRKEYGIHDRHLATLDGDDAVQSGVFIDDIDFETIKLDDMPDYALDLRKYSCLWIETHDGKYRAFIYVSRFANISGGTIHMKRYQMK